MSKMDGLRAMREARYEQDRARAAKRTAPPRVAPQSTLKSAAAPAPPGDSADSVAAGADADLCGHRNMSGRTCTRERGHAAKSHRYS
jgi:hypothetical protein